MEFYILLTPGMEIKAGDEFYKDGAWKPASAEGIGNRYTKFHYPARRKVTTLEELGEVLR